MVYMRLCVCKYILMLICSSTLHCIFVSHVLGFKQAKELTTVDAIKLIINIISSLHAQMLRYSFVYVYRKLTPLYSTLHFTTLNQPMYQIQITI